MEEWKRGTPEYNEAGTKQCFFWEIKENPGRFVLDILRKQHLGTKEERDDILTD